ncbi:MAG TPA: hypothetical protein DGH68_08530 [Bacteroidetes bacterium]|jgi:hypothetical protein|nr:hypothetical protein [Bacteroidota bacterium]
MSATGFLGGHIKNLPKTLAPYIFISAVFAQGGPWNNPLKSASSVDGRIFTPPAMFQDSSGVPSAIRWKGDTLVCAFQWFRQPIGSPTWDRVAVKFSYDAGVHWTDPTPILISAFPFDFQRPFDPTPAALSGDSIRIYFSSSRGTQPGQDSVINTYSAISADGIHYIFEPGARVDHPTRRVIDPAVIFFNGAWHYCSPVGAPPEGAYHYISPDGLTFSFQANYPSDNTHNWTGNYLFDGGSSLRFYGSGPQIWYNTSPDGFTWSGYVNTNVQGGDPTVVKISSANYLIIFVGQPYQTNVQVHEQLGTFALLQNYPNPFNPTTTIRYSLPSQSINNAQGRVGVGAHVTLKVYDILGREVSALVDGVEEPGHKSVQWDATGFATGVYLYRLTAGGCVDTKRFVLMR